MPVTPWSSSSSLVSDRIPRPQPPKQQQHHTKGKGKSKGATPEPLASKSQAVRALEVRLNGARGSNGHTKDTKGGCFCQARTHSLSSYVSMCQQCGLILCSLNPPYYACPHCANPLLNEHERATLVNRLEDELAAQLAREESERQRVIEEARVAQGAFPTLPGSQVQIAKSQGESTSTPVATTRTVLSLNSGTKKVMVSSYRTQTVTSRPASREEDRGEEGRVLPPPREVNYVNEPLDAGRPWRNVRVGDVRYVPLPGGRTKGSSKRQREGGERGAASTGGD